MTALAYALLATGWACGVGAVWLLCAISAMADRRAEGER